MTKQKEIAEIMAIIEKSITEGSKEGSTKFTFRAQDKILKGCEFAKYHVDVAKILKDKGFVIEGFRVSRSDPNYGFKVILPK